MSHLAVDQTSNKSCYTLASMLYVNFMFRVNILLYHPTMRLFTVAYLHKSGSLLSHDDGKLVPRWQSNAKSWCSVHDTSCNNVFMFVWGSCNNVVKVHVVNMYTAHVSAQNRWPESYGQFLYYIHTTNDNMLRSDKAADMLSRFMYVQFMCYALTGQSFPPLPDTLAVSAQTFYCPAKLRIVIM